MLRTALVRDLYPSEPLRVIRRLSGEMDRYFDGFGVPRALASWRDAEVWAPQVEAFARNGTFVVRADLPGLTEKDITVELAGNMLTLKGERKHEKEVKEADYYTCERSYGAFTRSVELPEGAKVDAAKASFKNGVLEVVIPNAPVKAPETRKLEVAAS